MAQLPYINRTPGRAPAPPAGAPTPVAEPKEEGPPPRRVGLINQGCTCYLNSLLQTLFHLSHFRSAVYKSSATAQPAEDEGLIPQALQQLFFQMQVRTTAVSTKVLTDAFGWDEREVFVQHDIQELAALLRETLEARMKGTPAEGYINNLFTGYGEKFFRTLDKSYTSRRPDTFYDVHVPVSGFHDLRTSLRSLIQTEMLTGDNKYKVEEEGKPAVYKDAETGYRFLRFPPVIFFHLKRFEMDMMSPTLDMKKVNSSLEFPLSLDLRDMEAGFDAESPEPDAWKRQTAFSKGSPPDYDLIGVVVHRGGVRSGHYFCYMREFDNASNQFGNWMEFDDDYVRYVDDGTAVMRNWGGYQTVQVRGIEQSVLSTQNAYMLVYARRTDTPQLLQPVSIDLVPTQALEVYQRLAAVDEETAREEEAKRKRCTFHLVTDSSIDEFVRFRNGTDLFSFSEPRGAIPLVVEKKMPWEDFLVKVGETMNDSPQTVRLWLFRPPPAVQGQQQLTYLRPNVCLPGIQDAEFAAMPIEKVLESVGLKLADESTHSKRPLSLAVYVERTKEHLPCLRTNIASHLEVRASSSDYSDHNAEPNKALQNQLFSFAHDDPAPRFELSTDDGQPIRITHVSFRSSKRQATATYRVEIHSNVRRSSLVWSEAIVDTYDVHETASGPRHFHFCVPDGVMGARIIIGRDSRDRFVFNISRVQVHTSAVDYPKIAREPSEIAGRKELVKCENKNTPDQKIIVMIKYFNHITGAIRFCGSAILSANELLANNMRELRNVCRLPSDAPIQVFIENRPGDIRPFPEHYFSNDSALGMATLSNGSVLILQQHPKTIPVCYRYNTVEERFAQFALNRTFNVRHAKEPEKVITTLLMNCRWDYVSTTEFLAGALSKPEAPRNPARFLLYGPKEVGQHPLAKPDPYRTDDELNLGQMTAWNTWPHNDLYFDEIDVDRKVFESTINVKCAYSGSELGDDAAEIYEFTLQREQASPSNVIAHVLQRAGKPFDRPHVLLEIRNHLITTYHEVGAGGTALSSSAHGPHLPKQKPVSRMFRDSDRSYEVRPHTPALGPDDWLVPVCYGEYDAKINNRCGRPFLAVAAKQDTARTLYATLMTKAPLAEDDKPKDAEHHLLLHIRSTLYYPDQTGTTVWTYFTHSQKEVNTVIRHVFINRKRPKEKPGSRYVAQADQQLVIDKRAKRRNRTTEGGAAGV